MHLDHRRIRSAGRTSGSIEITLPTELRTLEGVECRLLVRDGARPEIVLQPELSAANEVFHTLWRGLRIGFDDVGDIGSFNLSEYALCLLPPGRWHTHPPLVYVDALVATRWDHSQKEEIPEAIPRILTSLASGAAYRLDLAQPLARAFGDAVAYLMTGISTVSGNDFERGMAHRAFWKDELISPLGSPFEHDVWRKAQTKLIRVYDGFWSWERNPEVYDRARERWYRALTVEMGS